MPDDVLAVSVDEQRLVLAGDPETFRRLVLLQIRFHSRNRSPVSTPHSAESTEWIALLPKTE